MEDSTKKYLLQKLNGLINEIEAGEQPLLVKVADLSSKFEELKKSLEQQSTSTAEASNASALSEEQLYELHKFLMRRQRQIQIGSDKKMTTAIEYVSFYKFAAGVDIIIGQLRQERGQTNQANWCEWETEAFRWSTRMVDETKVHGLHDKAIYLQRLLVHDNTQFKAIGIVGIQGIGKTTLCQLIFNKEIVKAHFLPKIWVCMSKQPGDNQDYRKETVKRILACLDVEEEMIKSDNKRNGLKGLLYTLQLQLIGKRYLIVLDDVWGTEDEYKNFCSSIADDEKCSERLAYGLPKGWGGTVIVTSRADELAKGMVGEENLHRLQQISDPEICWKIFKDSVDSDGEQFSRQLETQKDKITEKCAGLPLAAKMMGQIAHEQLLSLKQQNVVDESRQEQSPKD